ncbi:type 1 glutamine amidotransferase domain-containing protein [Nocardia sp. NPDC058176]|uniref:type 1 glutamine amidotransferase domain-containing protein n=1 Tax=Nocardia sp. NPDC058176 TaxID=3346368 RepID=UPI0036DEC954
MARILFVMTGADQWSLIRGAKHHTGYWAHEFSAPYQAFTEAGHEIVVATPGGVVPPVDRGSLAPNTNGGDEQAAKVAEIIAGATPLEQPIALADARPADYAAVFYPGGHGPMEDLAVDPDSATLLVETLDSGKPFLQADRNLHTGQNPASAGPLAAAVLAAL